MELTLPEHGEAKGRLVLERGQQAGHVYQVEAEVCGNPVCHCKEVTLHCSPEAPAGIVASDVPWTLELDLERRALTKPAVSEATPASILAKAVMDEITAEHWHNLWNYFFGLKTLYTEQANLDELDAAFPPNARKGGMVGYYEILPFARPISFTAEGHQWAFDDQYCLRPDCECRAAVLQCFRIAAQAADASPSGPNLSIRYHYDTQRFEDLEKSGYSLSPQSFLDSIRKAQPDFDALLAKRHEQLRRLYRLFLKRHPFAGRRLAEYGDYLPESSQHSPAQPIRVAHKTGRNDLCPCGSGKKYKKCCGKN